MNRTCHFPDTIVYHLNSMKSSFVSFLLFISALMSNVMSTASGRFSNDVNFKQNNWCILWGFLWKFNFLVLWFSTIKKNMHFLACTVRILFFCVYCVCNLAKNQKWEFMTWKAANLVPVLWKVRFLKLKWSLKLLYTILQAVYRGLNHFKCC